MTDNWIRSSGKELIPTGWLPRSFNFTGEIFSISFDEKNPYSLQLEHKDNSQIWDIFLIEQQALEIKLSGMAHPINNLFDGTKWFELVLGKNTQLSFVMGEGHIEIVFPIE